MIPSQPTLARLRGVVATRPVNFAESLTAARQQATLLLSGVRSFAPPVPIELIMGLRHISVEFVIDQHLPSAGFWDTTTHRWVIQIASAMSWKQQRVALAREFKYILDYHYVADLYPGTGAVNSQYQANRAADYFAAHLLVPSRLLKHAWKAGLTTLSELSDMFAVPEPMIRQRLAETRLGAYASRTASSQLREDAFVGSTA